MNYTEMRDFEINWRVFEALHGGSPDFKEGENGTMVLVSEDYDVQMGEHVTIEAVRGNFNPCNSWADAGPIISNHGISIMKDSGLYLWCATSKAYWVDGSEWQMGQEWMDANPLRAAMIAFLMMQESK